MVSESYVERCMKKMRQWMELRALAAVTLSVYTRCARRFIEHVGKPLGAVTTKDVEQSLLELARKERSPRTRNLNLAAIRCALRATLRRDPSKDVPRARVERRSPEILWTTTMWNGEHGNRLPWLLAGSCGGSFKTNQLLRGVKDSSVNRVLTSVCNAMGVPVTYFGDPAHPEPVPGLAA